MSNGKLSYGEDGVMKDINGGTNKFQQRSWCLKSVHNGSPINKIKYTVSFQASESALSDFAILVNQMPSFQVLGQK